MSEPAAPPPLVDPPTPESPLPATEKRRGPIGRLRARIHAMFLTILAANASPGQLAAAVFIGAIVGATPLFGLHLSICIALAWVLRLNQVSMYAAANISLPPFIPFLGFASVQIGERLLRGQWLPLTVDEFRLMGHEGWHAVARMLFVDWLVGGGVVGAVIGVGFAALVYRWALERDRRRDSPILAAIAAASGRYRAAPRNLRTYALFKYRLDPCYRSIAALVAEGTFTVDLGTGLGMLPLVIALLPGERRVLGVDWDAPKLAAGRAAAAGLDRVELVEGDARTFAIPPCDVITLVDVLHYYEAEAQRALLGRCKAALRPSGKLLVREGDTGRGGSRWTRFIEWLAVRIGWNRGEGDTRFRAVDDLRRELEALGFAVSESVVAGRFHPGNVLLVGELPAGGTAKSLLS